MAVRWTVLLYGCRCRWWHGEFDGSEWFECRFQLHPSFKKTEFIEVCSICPRQSSLHLHGLPAVRSNMFTIINLIGLGMASGHLSYVAIKNVQKCHLAKNWEREREISDSQSIVLQISFEQPTFQDTWGATWRHSTAARFRGAYWSSAKAAWMKTQWRQLRLIPAMAVRLIDVDCTFHLEKTNDKVWPVDLEATRRKASGNPWKSTFSDVPVLAEVQLLSRDPGCLLGRNEAYVMRRWNAWMAAVDDTGPDHVWPLLLQYPLVIQPSKGMESYIRSRFTASNSDRWRTIFAIQVVSSRKGCSWKRFCFRLQPSNTFYLLLPHFYWKKQLSVPL